MINTDNTHVVLIGIESYQDEALHDLPSAFDDVAALSKVFTKNIGIPRKQIKRLIDIEERDDLMHKLKEVVKRKGVENLILYYAGHGVLDDDMTNYYLTLCNTEVDDLEFTGITVKKLSERLGSKNWNVILILDCCFSEKAFEQFSQRNFFVLASSAKNKTSKYPLNNDHSAFTGKLIQVINEGINNGKEQLSWDDIFGELKARLVTEGFPEPKKASRNDVGTLPFLLNNYKGESLKVGKSDQEYLEQLFDALVHFDETLIHKRNEITNSSTFQQEFKKLILEKYPYPISYFLKNLLPDMEEAKAEYLYKFYEKTVQFLALTLIADIAPREDKSDEMTEMLEQLDKPDHAFYLKIIPMIREAFGSNLFMKEFSERYEHIWKDLRETEQLRIDKCEDTEIIKKELIDLIAQLGFMSKYLFLSVRFIDVQTGYIKHTSFRHQVSILHGENLKPYLNRLAFKKNYLKSSSILIFKEQNISAIDSTTEYINLWPLIIDVNSFEAKNNVPEIHFFEGRQSDDYLYKLLNTQKQPFKTYKEHHKTLPAKMLKRFFNEFESQLF